uniref:Mediator of RNA polymerase II transcription subunit 22 n=1 Tax=Rodentolepis nana TaxID=102285 RepID=A0A0R3TZX5_RODNA
LRKSIAAVVASISPNYMKYVAVVKQQNYQKIKETNTAREDIEDMEGIFEQLLQYHRCQLLMSGITESISANAHSNSLIS